VKLSKKYIGPVILVVGLVFFEFIYTNSDPTRIFQVWRTGSYSVPLIVVCNSMCYLEAVLVMIGWFVAIVLMLVGAIVSIEYIFPRESV